VRAEFGAKEQDKIVAADDDAHEGSQAGGQPAPEDNGMFDERKRVEALLADTDALLLSGADPSGEEEAAAAGTHDVPEAEAATAAKADMAAMSMAAAEGNLLTKTHMGLQTRLLHPSDIVNAETVNALEVSRPPVRCCVQRTNRGFYSPRFCRVCCLLQAALPEDLQGFDWSLLYSLNRDGPSFQTFYECAKGHMSTLITVNTSSGTCFGAYTSDEWVASSKYFGSDDCFVFRTGAQSFEKFACTGANKFYQLANEVRMLGIPDLPHTCPPPCQHALNCLSFAPTPAAGLFGCRRRWQLGTLSRLRALRRQHWLLQDVQLAAADLAKGARRWCCRRCARR
jgi:hypothetical protein